MTLLHSIAILLAAVSVDTQVSRFAEGYSSEASGLPAGLSWREFTIYTGREACAASPVPSAFVIRPAPIVLKVGERLHRTPDTELIIEAYDQKGTFLPRVPIIVNIASPEEVLESRSDWNYMEAAAPGEGELTTLWYCADEERVEHRVFIKVTAE